MWTDIQNRARAPSSERETVDVDTATDTTVDDIKETTSAYDTIATPLHDDLQNRGCS